MVHFQINMARSRVIPAARRRLWYQMLVLYLGLSGVILVLLAGTATRHLVAAFDRRHQLMRLEEQCLQSCAGYDDIEDYARQAGIRMTAGADSLEAIVGILGNRIQAAMLVFGLAVPLPGEMALNNVDLNAEKRELAFEVWVPENGATPGMTPPNLVPLWTRNPTLMAHVGQLASVNSQRTRMNGRGFSIWRFTGRLPKKDGD